MGGNKVSLKQSHEFSGSCIQHLMTDRATGSFVTAVAACMTPRLLAMASFSICTAYGTTTGTGAGCLRSLFFPMSLDSHASNNSTASMRSLSMRRRVPQALTKRQEDGGEMDTGRQEESSKCAVVSKLRSGHDDMTILHSSEASTSKYAGFSLLVNNSGNILSMYKQDSIWTDLYFDEFAILPAVVPEGPIAILGLGGGTAARILLTVWPSQTLEGWEIDEMLVDKAREYLGLKALESATPEGGILTVHIGDALSSKATVEGGFAGIVVDLFQKGEVLPQLQKVKAWRELKQKLRCGGRIMVNCGGTSVERRDPELNDDDGTWTWEDGSAARDTTLSAMAQVFPELNLRKMDTKEDNYLALTGPLPDKKSWAAAVPERLRPGIFRWSPFQANHSIHQYLAQAKWRVTWTL